MSVLDGLFQRRRVPFAIDDADVKADILPRDGERWSVNVDIADIAMPKIAEAAIHEALRAIAHDLRLEVYNRAIARLTTHDLDAEIVKVIQEEARAYFKGMFGERQ